MVLAKKRVLGKGLTDKKEDCVGRRNRELSLYFRS